MSILDNLKNKLKPKNPKMRVCMMGARGVGKTSVLTSMFKNLNGVNSNTNLQLTTLNDSENGGQDSTTTLINERYNELVEMFHSSSEIGDVTNSGIAGSFEVHTFNFQFGVKGKSTRIDLEIKDFPGEYIFSEPEEVSQFISESNAIIVAVDTPHLMECNGSYNEGKNCVKVITDFFTKCFSDLKDDKLVMFVPLKCEKYYNNGTINEVLAAVENAYAELISLFKSQNLKDKITCVVTPILTVGEVEFDRFATNEDGSIKVLQNAGIPVKAIYKFSKKNAAYAPKYCEQPLCYLLSFVAKLYARAQQSSGKTFFEKLSAIFKLFPDDPTLLMEINKFSRRRIKDSDGYKVLQGEYKV